MVAHPEVDVMNHPAHYINSTGSVVARQGRTPDNHEHFKFFMYFYNAIVHSTVMAKNEDWFSYDFVGASDYDLWLRLLFGHKKTWVRDEEDEKPVRKIRFSSLNKYLLLYRRHDKSMTKNARTDNT
jgi:hypothetical protein